MSTKAEKLAALDARTAKLQQRRGPSIITKTLSHRPAAMHPKNFLTPDNARRLGAL